MKKFTINLTILLTTLLILCLCNIKLPAQKGTPEVKLRKLDVVNNKLIIEYDIENADTSNPVDIGIYFLDDRSKTHIPKTLSGDFGNQIYSGNSKTIIWDVSNDFNDFKYLLRPQFIINGMKEGTELGGPKWAYLSMAMPGMGDYFVVDHKETIIKPYIRTAAFLTFLGLGIKGLSGRTTEKESRFIGYRVERANPIVNQIIYELDENGDRIPTYGEVNVKNAWLFHGDFEVFFGVAGTIWLLDILYVANKGKKNENARKYFDKRNSFELGYFNQRPGFRYSYTF